MRAHQPGAGAKPAARILTVLCAVLVSCGPAQTSSQAGRSTTYPISVVQAGGAKVTITHQPHRIVSLSPTATEILFAIGAGKQVIAVDDQSNYPASAPATKLSGITPNIEAIASYAPDLVVAAEDAGGLVHGMQALNVPILIEPAARNLDDTYSQVDELGAVTDHLASADDLVAKMRSQIAAFMASVAKPTRPLRVYHELDNTYYSVTSATFLGQVYKLLGLRNIADAATGAAPDYPQLSAEYIVSSNPDIIVLADTKCCAQTLSTVAARPGWSVIAAVKSGQVIGVDDDVASRWGPRVVDFMQAVAPHVQQLEKAG